MRFRRRRWFRVVIVAIFFGICGEKFEDPWQRIFVLGLLSSGNVKAYYVGDAVLQFESDLFSDQG